MPRGAGFSFVHSEADVPAIQANHFALRGECRKANMHRSAAQRWRGQRTGLQSLRRVAVAEARRLKT